MATNNSVNTSLSSQTGTGAFVGSTSPTLVTPILGVAAATSINFGGSALSAYVDATNWTPVVTFATPGNLSVSYSNQAAWYVTIGRITFVNFTLTFTPTFTTASGEFRITGQPVTASFRNSIGNVTLGSVVFTAGYTFVSPVAQSGVNYLILEQAGTAGALASMTTTNFPTGSPYLVNGSVAIFNT